MAKRGRAKERVEREEREMTRYDESRDYDKQTADERDFYDSLYISPMYLSPEEIPSGMEYRWIRHDIFGERDNGRLTEASQKRWTPVPSSRHPRMQTAAIFDVDLNSKHIFYKGSILCERPAKFGAMEEKALEEQHNKVINSMPAYKPDPGIFGTKENTTKLFTSKW